MPLGQRRPSAPIGRRSGARTFRGAHFCALSRTIPVSLGSGARGSQIRLKTRHFPLPSDIDRYLVKSLSKKYLPLYLAEFQFRHNNRKNLFHIFYEVSMSNRLRKNPVSK
jgi:hypothetical protein